MTFDVTPFRVFSEAECTKMFVDDVKMAEMPTTKSKEKIRS